MITLKYDMKLISKDNDCIVNRYTHKKILSPKYRKFSDDVKRLTKQQYKGEVLSGNVGVQIIALFKNKKHCDCGNLSKGILDSLQEIVYANDSQIKELYVRSFEGEEKDAFIVEIDPELKEIKPAGIEFTKW